MKWRAQAVNSKTCPFRPAHTILQHTFCLRQDKQLFSVSLSLSSHSKVCYCVIGISVKCLTCCRSVFFRGVCKCFIQRKLRCKKFVSGSKIGRNICQQSVWCLFHFQFLLFYTRLHSLLLSLPLSFFLQSCQADLVKDNGHKYFLSVLADPYMPVSIIQMVLNNFPLCSKQNLF